MFSHKNVKLYLQKLVFDMTEDTVKANATIYVTPITKGLASSINMAEDVVSALFNGNGKPWAHLSNIGFKSEPEPCSLEYYLHEEVKSGHGIIPYVEFSSIRAMKLFADSEDWTLAFNAKFECNDKEQAWNFINRIKKTFVGTFGKVQGDLFPKTIPACAADILEKDGSTRACGVAPKFKVKGQDEYYCTDHPRAAGDGVELETLTKDEIMKWSKALADNELQSGKSKSKKAGK